MRRAVAFLMTVAFCACALSTARAHELELPMTGQRTRPIESETLFHTLFSDFFDEADGTTYVQTGDIPAMWLRDSSAQTIPYIRFQPYYPVLRARFAGVIERDARNILTDPYANAFMANYHIWERKWEVDSLAWPVILAYVYIQQTNDATIYSPTLHRALRSIVDTYRCEQLHATCSRYAYPYRVYTQDAYNPGTGMIWTAFRPSDDAVQYRYNIPQNALAVVALRDLAILAVDGYGDTNLANEANSIAAAVQLGIERYGVVWNPSHGARIYAYEVDGNGHANLMDDANIPNLTTLPYIGWCSSGGRLYLDTRTFTLSRSDPWYFSGTYATGLGSPHTPYGFVWPLGIVGRALTATSSSEVAESITTLAETDSKDGLIHESFNPNGYWRYTRAEFGWANALSAELIFRSVAGFNAVPFVGDDLTIVPFEHPIPTPTLATPTVQLENAGAIVDSLGQLLATSSEMPTRP
jgi:meiotically up-regulated gene 157 (Mug157) protein